MAHTYHELKEKTIQELREIAKEVKHDAVQGPPPGCAASSFTVCSRTLPQSMPVVMASLHSYTAHIPRRMCRTQSRSCRASA